MILLTGSTGFVGHALLDELMKTNQHSVVVANRKKNDLTPSEVKQVVVGDLNGEIDWKDALQGVKTVIHIAGKAHVSGDDEHEAAQFKIVNTDATVNLAEQAALSGVERFIYISSVKVNGECSVLNTPFRFDDSPVPLDPYGQSKYNAELGLIRVAETNGMAYVILRPVLVYGPGVKANFRKMIELVAGRTPLPVGAINNKRSFLAIDNFVDLILMTIDNTNATNKIFMVSDGEDVSTTELFSMVRDELGSKAVFLKIPEKYMWFALRLLRKNRLAGRLLGSLHVDLSPTIDTLDWCPPVKMADALASTIRAVPTKEKQLCQK